MTNRLKASLLLAAALLVPACGDGKKETATGTGASSANVLMSEKFETVFPGTQWTPALMTGTGASAIVDGSSGAPTPSLALALTDGPSSIGTSTVTAFASRSLTVSVQMSASSDAEGSGGIGLFDSTGQPVAVAEWHPATPAAITLRILGTTVGVTPPSPGALFHQFVFTVTASGEASWTIDGAAIPAMTQSGFPSDMLNVNLYSSTASSSATSFATFRFDNVTVTSP
jgi:hypothetical protein